MSPPSAAKIAPQEYPAAPPRPVRRGELVQLVAIFWFINVVHSYAIGSPDACKQLLASFNVGSHITDSVERQKLLSDLVDVGLTSSLFAGMGVGIMADYLGPKIVILTGIICNFAAMCFWGLSSKPFLHTLGVVLVGVPRPCMTVAFASVGNLSMNHRATIIGVLGTGFNVSSALPIIWKFSILKIGPLRTLLIFCAVSVPTAIAAFLYVPSAPFETDQRSSRAEMFGQSKATVAQEMATVPYALFLLSFTFSLFRYTYFYQNAREILGQVALSSGKDLEAGARLVDILNAAMSFPGFALLFFWLSDVLGFCNLFLIVQITFALLMGAPAIFGLSGQWITLLSCCLVSSILYGQLTLFVVQFFGFGHFGMLQGFQLLGAVVGVWATIPWLDFVETHLGHNHIGACKILTALSVVALAVPIVLRLHYSYLLEQSEQLCDFSRQSLIKPRSSGGSTEASSETTDAEFEVRCFIPASPAPLMLRKSTNFSSHDIYV